MFKQRGFKGHRNPETPRLVREEASGLQLTARSTRGSWEGGGCAPLDMRCPQLGRRVVGEVQAAPGRCCQEDGDAGGLQEGGDESHDEMSFFVVFSYSF